MLERSEHIGTRWYVHTHTYRLYVCSSQNTFWTEHAKAPTNTVHNCLFLQIFFSQLQPSANPGLSATERRHFGARCMSRRQSFWNGFVHPLEHPLRQLFRPELRTVLMICRRTWCSHIDRSKNGGHQSKDTLCFYCVFVSCLSKKTLKAGPAPNNDIQWWPIWTDYLLRISFQVHLDATYTNPWKLHCCRVTILFTSWFGMYFGCFRGQQNGSYSAETIII